MLFEKRNNVSVLYLTLFNDVGHVFVKGNKTLEKSVSLSVQGAEN